MWAQQWNNIYDDLIPFKGKTGVDVTPVLKEKVSIHDIYGMTVIFFRPMRK